MHHVPIQTARRSRLRIALVLAAAVAILPGCVSGSKTSPDIADIVPADPREGITADVAQAADQPSSQDQQVAAVAGQTQAAPTSQAAMMPMVAQTAQPGSIILQTTGLKATSSSIFSSQPAGMAPAPAASAEPQPVPVDNATPHSLYRTPSSPAKTAPLAPQPVQPLLPAPVQGAAATPAQSRQIGMAGKAAQGIEVAGTQSLPTQVATLGYSAFSGMRRRTMFATSDDASPEHDDKSPVVEMASLPGLARLAPNGLWLQTESVETGCFKPDLMQLLTTVEAHYGKKILVTSGMRDLEHNRRVGGRPLSLHTSCRAADIQVPGVSKWDLATYLRSLPGRGGVGTYCHTASVHIDVGRNRDWNWPCPQREV